MQNKQLIIILEGHDMSGKSSIAKALSKEYSLPIFKIEHDNTWWDPHIGLKYITRYIAEFIKQTKCSVILDRWVPSDYVYNTLFKRDLDLDLITQVDTFSSKMNALLIVCYKNKEYKKIDKIDQYLVKPDDYQKMTKLYFQFAKKTKCKTLKLNTTDENLEKQLQQIKKFINENRYI